MTDTSVTPVTPPQDPSSGNSGKSPLDVLDQILNEAKNKATQTADQKAAEEKERLEAERVRQAQEDHAKLIAEQQKIQEMKSSPQYQAAVAQKQEQTEQQSSHAEKMKGTEIVQLGHTQI